MDSTNCINKHLKFEREEGLFAFPQRRGNWNIENSNATVKKIRVGIHEKFGLSVSKPTVHLNMQKAKSCITRDQFAMKKIKQLRI